MPLDYPIHERTLPNGLRVIVSPDHSVPTVTVNIWVNVGSRHEEPGHTGFAHLFEHLMFQGSANVESGEHFSALMAHGGRLNATTWFDRTNYFETVPTQALDLALWLEADRHGHLLAAVNQDNLDNQRDVVKEEKRQRYDNVPYGTALQLMYAALFPDDHPYHHSTIGSMEDLDAASVEDVHAFFRRYYGPDNMVLTLVGDIEPEAGFAAVETYFGALAPTGLAPRANLGQLSPAAGPIRVDQRAEVPNDRLHIAFRLPVDPTREFLATALALDALGGLSSSRLVRRLVRRERVANSVGAHAMGLVDGASIGFVVVDLADGADPDAVESAVAEELGRFVEEGPTSAELEAALAQTERAYLTALAAHDERADALSHAALLHGDPGLVNSYLDRIADISAEEVRAAAAAWLQPDHRVVLAHLAVAEEDAA